MPKALRHKSSKPHHFWHSLPKSSQVMMTGQLGIAASANPLQILSESLVRYIASREPFSSESVAEEEFQCSHCQGILYHPVTASCGRSFCQRCSRKDKVDCKHCNEQHETSTFSKLNVTLEKIIETWYEDEYLFHKLLNEGDELLSKSSFEEAEKKFSAALEKKPFHNYASMRRALARIEQCHWNLAFIDVTSVKMRHMCSVSPYAACSNDHVDSLVAEQNIIAKKIVKTYLEVLSMLQANSPAFDAANCFHNLTHLSHHTEPAHALMPHEVNSAKYMASARENNGTTFMIECESTLDAVILEELSSTNWKSHFSELFKGMSRRSLSENDFANKFDEDDYSCILCTRPFYDPVCTPCGHTFCLECLERCFDHGQACPMCKTTLTDIYRYQKFLLSIDWSVESFMRRFLPNLCAEREKLRLEECNRLRENFPVFVCTVAYPQIRTMLHIFEPRYRLMIRRALKYHGGAFGITMPSPTSQFHCIGTLIQIEKVSFFPDGRSLITAVGSSRFRVEEYGTCDGYGTAKVCKITDEVEPDGQKRQQITELSNEVYTKAKAWFDNSSERFRLNASMMYGDFPEQDNNEESDGPRWAWWLTAVLPLKDDVKSLILGKTCLRSRLSMLNLVLNKIRRSSSNT